MASDDPLERALAEQRFHRETLERTKRQAEDWERNQRKRDEAESQAALEKAREELGPIISSFIKRARGAGIRRERVRYYKRRVGRKPVLKSMRAWVIRHDATSSGVYDSGSGGRLGLYVLKD